MLRYRPHHFLCTLGFQGKGYSEDFVAGFQRIAHRLRETPDGDSVLIEVTVKTDSICLPCPSRRGDLCESEAKIQRLDGAHARVLGLKDGDTLSWGEAKKRIAENFSDAQFDAACAPCSWKTLGVCHTALKKLRAGAAALMLALTLAATPGQAAKGPLAPLIAQPQPIDTVRAQLFPHHGSAKARAVGEALLALKEEKFEKARKLAQPLQSDEIFADYYSYLMSVSWRAQARSLFSKKRHDEALATAQKSAPFLLKLESDFPYSPLLKKVPEELANAELVLADAYFGKNASRPAQKFYERAFQRLQSLHQLGLLEPETLERYARSCKKDPGLLCAAWLNRFSALYPKDSEELKAIARPLPELATRARLSYAAGNLSKAYKAPDLDQAAFEAALALCAAEKNTAAIKALRKFLDEYPRSGARFRARYWLAQSLRNDGEHEQARKTFEAIYRESPFSWHGLLSSLAIGKPLDAGIDLTLPLAISVDPSLNPLEVVRIKRGERFLAEGVRGLGIQELHDLRPRDALSSPFLMYLAALNNEAGNYLASFTLITELIARQYEGIFSSFGVRMIFPIAHFELIQKYAKLNRLDPVLVLSLMKQESAFEAAASSPVGASGLMQLMPTTAVETDSKVRRAELLDPETNIRVGTLYLRKLLDKFNGNIALALAGYNAGPNAVTRWLREGRGKRGLLEFIEAIPYRETRDYVGAIIRNHFWYSRRLTGETPASLSYFWNLTGPPETPVELPAAATEAEKPVKESKDD